MFIVGFGKTLGLGGEQVAVAFDNTELVKQGEETNVRIGAQEAQKFGALK